MKTITKSLIAIPGIPIILVLCSMYEQNPFWIIVSVVTTLGCMIGAFVDDEISYFFSGLYVSSMTILWLIISIQLLNQIMDGIMNERENIGYCVLSVVFVLSWMVWGFANTYLKIKS